MSVDFDVRGNDGMELLTGFHSVIIMDSCLCRSDELK